MEKSVRHAASGSGVIGLWPRSSAWGGEWSHRMAFSLCASLLIAGLSCATKKGPENGVSISAGPEIEKSTATAVFKVHSFEEAVTQMKLAIVGRPCGAGDRITAIAWEQGVPGLEEFAKESIAGAKGAILAGDMGISSSSVEELSSQLDPDTFCGVWWVNGQVTGREVEGLDMVFISLAGEKAGGTSIRFSPPLKLGPSGASPVPSALFGIREKVISSEFYGNADELWWVSKKRLVRYSLKWGKELQVWPLPGEGGGEQRTDVALRLFDSPSGGAMVGLYNPSAQKGGWFTMRDDTYTESAELAGFPLSEKERRFLKAEYSPDEGAFTLSDFGGREIATFTRLERVWGAGESVLVLQRTDGGLSAVRGNTLEHILPPVDGKVSAYTCLDRIIYLVEESSPDIVVAFSLGGGGIWESGWRSGEIPGRVSALCGGVIDSKTKLIVFTDEDKGDSSVYLLELPGTP